LPSFITWSSPASSCSIGAEASKAMAERAKADMSKPTENASRKTPCSLMNFTDIEFALRFLSLSTK
jgi:hypothetical protein